MMNNITLFVNDTYNKTANSTFAVYVQDGTGDVTVASYANSGAWEHLEVERFINENAPGLYLTLNVKNTATSDALVDGIMLYTAEAPEEFERALRATRWNSFLLTATYFKLIHSGIPPYAIKEMFAVDRPLLQFKSGMIRAEDANIAPFLKSLDPERTVQLLENYVFVQPDEVDHPLYGALLSPGEYESNIRESSFAQDPEEDNHGFSYSIERYDYNTLRLNVSTTKSGILYWSDGYDNKWHVYINGREAPLYRANVNFKAVAIPAGSSHVKFIYRHPLLRTAYFAYYGTLFVSLIAAGIFRIYRKVPGCDVHENTPVRWRGEGREP